jgi:hypothetical protein
VCLHLHAGIPLVASDCWNDALYILSTFVNQSLQALVEYACQAALSTPLARQPMLIDDTLDLKKHQVRTSLRHPMHMDKPSAFGTQRTPLPCEKWTVGRFLGTHPSVSIAGARCRHSIATRFFLVAFLRLGLEMGHV